MQAVVDFRLAVWIDSYEANSGLFVLVSWI